MNGRRPFRNGPASWPHQEDYGPASASRELVPARMFDDENFPGRGGSPFARGAKVFLRAAAISLTICAIGFALLHARLAHSPISLSFVTPTVENAVNASLKGMRFEIGDAVIQRSQTHLLGVEFRLAGIRLLDGEGDPIAESPFASGSFSISALLSGRLAASHIELIGPKLYVHFSEESGLALSFSDPRDSKGDLAIAQEAAPGAAADRPAANAASPVFVDGEEEGIVRQARGRAVNMTRALAQLFERSRSGESAYLTSFGIKDAMVYLDSRSQISRWQIASVEIDLDHESSRSKVRGNATIRAANETFDVHFGARQDLGNGQITLSVGVDDLVPRAFGGEFPNLRLPKMWDMPVTLTAEMQLAENGDILTGAVEGELKQGNFYAPWDERHPAAIDSGTVRMTYSREDGLIRLVNTELRWGESRMSMSGQMQRQPQTGRWAFDFISDELALGAEQFGLPVIPLDRMAAQGEYDPSAGAILFDRFFVQAADAYIALAGQIVQGRRSPAIRMAGQVSAMPVAFFKLIWPKFIAHDAREWIGERITAGRIAGGTLNVDIPANMLARLETGGSLPQEAVDFQLDLRNLQMHYIPGLPPMEIAQGTMRVAGQRFFFNAPEGEVIAPSGEPLRFSAGQFIIGDLRPFIPEGEIHFKSESSASAILSILDHPKLGYVSKLDMPLPEIDASASSAFSMSMKLVKDLEFEHIRMTGRTLLNDVRATNLPGGFGSHGGSLKFDVSSEGIEADGELSLNGIPVLVGWGYRFAGPDAQQPPLILRTVLDARAREELGMDAAHVLQGPAPAEFSLNFREGAPPRMAARVNLNEARITAPGWDKPAGVPASLSFELEPVGDEAVELRDITFQGDDFQVSGALRLNEKRRPVAFNLPVIKLNARTQIQARGHLRTDNVWAVEVRGAEFDGRNLFRSLLSAGRITEHEPRIPDDAPGLDMDVELGRITGFFNATLDTVKMSASRRGNALVALDLHGQLNGDRPFAARLEKKDGGPRTLVAQATDAGAAFRLVGFYPSARGGEATLNVNMDASGGAEKAGRLYAQNFVIVNDEVVDEVLTKPQGAGQAPAQQLQFDRMNIRFAVGGGRFVIQDALINGPLLGATLRGSIDFPNETISLGGTYVPLYGINGALGFVPILGDLLISRSGEGLFGITFAVKGKTSKPEVLVNPMSMVAPGFLRQIFEFNQPGQQQTAPPPAPPAGRSGARSSSLPATTQ